MKLTTRMQYTIIVLNFIQSNERENTIAAKVPENFDFFDECNCVDRKMCGKKKPFKLKIHKN